MPYKKKFKIAVLIRRFISTGGAERYATEVTRRLARENEVHVFAQEWSFSGTEKITFHKVPIILSKPSWLNQLLFSHLCARAVGREFDIVHSHEKVTRFDVMTIHSPCFRSFITQEERWWKRIPIWFSAALSPRQLAWLWLEKKQFTCNPNRLFIAVSEMVQRDVQASYPLLDECFRIAYPGVAMSIKGGVRAGENLKDLLSELDITKDELVILFVGTEFKRKGLDALLRALSLTLPSKVRLVVAGGGGGKMKRYVELTKELGLSEHVFFLGLVENVEKLYAIAHAIILPTLSDPWAMAPVEAMLHGVPAAFSSSKYCGAAERIKCGEALIIKNPRDHHEIAETLHKLMNPDLRAELAQRGQAFAAALTWEKTTASTLSAYTEVLRRKSHEWNH